MILSGYLGFARIARIALADSSRAAKVSQSTTRPCAYACDTRCGRWVYDAGLFVKPDIPPLVPATVSYRSPDIITPQSMFRIRLAVRGGRHDVSSNVRRMRRDLMRASSEFPVRDASAHSLKGGARGLAGIQRASWTDHRNPRASNGKNAGACAQPKLTNHGPNGTATC